MRGLLIVAAILYGGIAINVAVIAWVNYGIYERNLLRTFIKAASAVIWPVVLIRAIRRWSGVYFKTRFKREWEELFPVTTESAEVLPPKRTVADLSPPESSYKPGQWVN